MVGNSDDSMYRKYRYIVFDIDTQYRIVEKISNFSVYHDIQKYCDIFDNFLSRYFLQIFHYAA